eukprot:1154088-Pelagomonas_calceolata.AAC.9
MGHSVLDSASIKKSRACCFVLAYSDILKCLLGTLWRPPWRMPFWPAQTHALAKKLETGSENRAKNELIPISILIACKRTRKALDKHAKNV